LAWYEATANGQYREHVLKEVPGARLSVIHDFNRDGLLDIAVLMTQAREGVCIFYNLGEGHFREKWVLQFPAVYGSSYIELADFNGDGFMDILYTNGDNADYSPILKYYHGIRLLLNDGQDHFKEAWFYPMYGAGKALARDFDQDGDLDVAAISFFPDFGKEPEKGFVYLENSGGLNFQPYVIKEAAKGRWMTFDAGDADEDGDLDICLGSFVFSNNGVAAVEPARESGLLLLLNQTQNRIYKAQ
jgi:hypothetical protein